MSDAGGKRPEAENGNEDEVTFDLGLGGIFKGLGDFVDLIGKMAEQGQAERHRTGRFRVKGAPEQVRGVYGFTVRTGIGGRPHVETFGNVRATDEGPEVADVREPLVDVFEEDDEVALVVELPGVSEDEVHIDIRGDIVALETTGERKYAKETLLTSPVDAASLRKTYRNGILELRLRKQSR